MIEVEYIERRILAPVPSQPIYQSIQVGGVLLWYFDTSGKGAQSSMLGKHVTPELKLSGIPSVSVMAGTVCLCAPWLCLKVGRGKKGRGMTGESLVLLALSSYALCSLIINLPSLSLKLKDIIFISFSVVLFSV